MRRPDPRSRLPLLVALLALDLAWAPGLAGATAASPGDCASAFDDTRNVAQICADLRGFPLQTGQPFAARRFALGNAISQEFTPGELGVPEGVSAFAAAYISASQNVLDSGYRLSVANMSDFDVVGGTKNWTPVGFYPMEQQGLLVPQEVEAQVVLNARILEVSSNLTAAYGLYDAAGMPVFTFDAFFNMVGSPGSLSIVGSASVNGQPISFLPSCGPDDCSVSVSTGALFDLMAGFYEVDGFLAGGDDIDAAQTFQVTLTAPEGQGFSIVPEPGTGALVGGGLAAFARRRRAGRRS